jgi:hypothetical protein
MLKAEKIDLTDKLETMILMLLESKSANYVASEIRANKYIIGIDCTKTIPCDDLSPSSPYTCIATNEDEERFSYKKEYLLNNPLDILNEKSEIALLTDISLQWYGFEKIKKIPKGLFVFGKCSSVYAIHYRQSFLSGHSLYSKRMIGFDKQGNPLQVRWNAHQLGQPAREGMLAILACSLIEDAHRSNAMLAQVKDSTEIVFPVPLDDYKEVFSNRDKAEGDLRRKSILHWVTKHLRKTPSANLTSVKRHTRGIDQFTVDGLSVKISAN